MVSLSQFFRELRRRSVLRVATAYIIVAWLLIQVVDVIVPMLALPDWVGKFVLLLLGVGFPVALIFAWAYELTPGGIRREAASARSDDTQPESEPARAHANKAASIAVLPFVDMSPEQDQGYFCDGVAEEILNQLCRIPGLRVASRTGSFQFRGDGADIAQVGQRLNVNAVLEGSVRKSGDQLRITAQLINIKDGYHLWSERFDTELSDIFAVQDQIAGNITKALRLTVDPVTQQFMHGGRTNKIKAYEYYLRAWSHFYRYGKFHLWRAREMFRRAVDIDPQFARAWAGLAVTDTFYCIYVRRLDELVEESSEASHRAVKLCPTLPETQSARGLALIVDNDYQGAETFFQEALRCDPDHYESLYFYARACAHQGRFEEAAALYERAALARPEDYTALMIGAQVLDSLGREKERKDWLEKGLQLVKQHLEFYPNDVRALYFAATAHVVLGDFKTGKALIDKAVDLEPDDGPVAYNAACFYALAGDKETAMDLLERGAKLGMAGRSWVKNDADFKTLRSEPRFQAILKNLPE